ncbi:MAG: lytic transglycosylase domain-containing protein [Gemmatimonadota bacterium]
MRRSWLVLAVACAAAPVLFAQAPACPPPPALGAESLLTLGRFWHAERAAPVLPRAPRPVPIGLAVLHARIRAGLERWEDVDEVLRRARGADSVPDALLLWATASERLDNWAAAEARFRRLADLPATSAAVRPVALVHRAAALEVLGRRDSAEAAWRRAAQALPEIADWFAIRRAKLERDTALAFVSVSAARTPGARQRAALFVAQRRVMAGNLAGALEVYRRYGRSLDIARVEWAMGQRRTARLRADSLLLQDPTKPQALLAANFLAERYDSLTVRELAGVARVYRALNDPSNAERHLRRALQRADTSVALWLELAALHSDRKDLRAARVALDSAERRARRRAASLVTLARVTVLAAAKEWDEADTLTARAVRLLPGDSNVAKAVLVMAEHDRAYAQAAAELRRYWLLLRRFPAATATNTARFRLGLVLYAQGDADSAAAAVADVIARDSTNLLGTAPRFWAARLRLERGDSAGRVALQRIAAQEPLSYYGVRARELTGDTVAFFVDTALAPPRPGSFPPARARERIRLLANLGFESEARAEALGWAADTTASPQVLFAAAAAAGAAGFAREAIRLGEAAQVRAGLTAGAARGLMPFPYRSVIEAESAEHCLDPLLLAAIIRQESRFTPRAVSRAGARGISQVMPATGRELAQRLRIAPWDADLLFVPDFNLHLGAHFLADRFRVDSFPVYAAIAAYNAGFQRVDRWRRWPEFGDPDLFVERVAIPETRTYVRIVYASYQWYRRAYADSLAGASSPAVAAPLYP